VINFNEDDDLGDEEKIKELSEKLSNINFGEVIVMPLGTPEAIQDIIHEVERRGNKVLFAIESGSRLWGMGSEFSDYDVRFVYVKPIKEYLKVFAPKSDQIDIQDRKHNIDAVGWDVKKFLKLAANGNPQAMEWISADIVYHGDPDMFKDLKRQASPLALFESYRGMADSNYKRYIFDKVEVHPKKYLYALRGIANMIYVASHLRIPPPRLEEVLDENVFPQPETEVIRNLIKDKRAGEMAKGERITQLDELIHTVLSNSDAYVDKLKNLEKTVDPEYFNNRFLEVLGLR